MSCIVCNKVESTRWYYDNTTCRSCHRKKLYWNKPETIERLLKAAALTCLDCGISCGHTKAKNKVRCTKCQRKDYIKRNKKQLAQSNRAWKKENRDKVNEGKRLGRKNNPYPHRLEATLRKKYIKQATPVWINKAELAAIWKDCPESYQVDHIIPLRGKDVCGLNVPWNLQYLTSEENNKKSNKFSLEVSSAD